MNDDQITALAREYAEEIYPHEEGEDLGQMEFLRTSATKHIKASLKMLSRRFCLVEKEAVRKEYREATAHMEEAIKSKNPLSEACGKGKRLVIKSLFPEIGKEVES